MADVVRDRVFWLVREIDRRREQRETLQNEIQAFEKELNGLLVRHPKGGKRAKEPMAQAIVKLLDGQPEKVFQIKEIAGVTGGSEGSVIARCAELVTSGKIGKARPRGYRSLLSKGPGVTLRVEVKDQTEVRDEARTASG